MILKKKELLLMICACLILSVEPAYADQIADGLKESQKWLSAQLGLGCAIIGAIWAGMNWLGGDKEKGIRILSGVIIGTAIISCAPFIIVTFWNFFN